ncbi:hypothetical protein KGP36_04090 [Patescibacteria group bacterium]|nr:hypothetical protein [Patescibacteria group bacterium]
MANYYLSPVAGAGAQFFDNNGAVAAGGELYTYAAGTTTLQTTYTTSAGNVANANPILLDSAGRVPNEIWFPEGQNFKFVLQVLVNGAWLTLWTADNIYGLGDNLYGTSGAGQVSTTNATTNSISTAGGINAVGAVAAGSAAITGAITGSSISVSGAVTGASAAITNGITGASVSVSGAVTGASAAVTGAVTAASASTSGAINAGSSLSEAGAAISTKYLGVASQAVDSAKLGGTAAASFAQTANLAATDDSTYSRLTLNGVQILFQTASVTTDVNGNAQINFPVNFSTKCLGVLAVPGDNNVAGLTVTVGFGSITTASVSVTTNKISTTVRVTIAAFGY